MIVLNSRETKALSLKSSSFSVIESKDFKSFVGFRSLVTDRKGIYSSSKELKHFTLINRLHVILTSFIGILLAIMLWYFFINSDVDLFQSTYFCLLSSVCSYSIFRIIFLHLDLRCRRVNAVVDYFIEHWTLYLTQRR